VKVKTKHPLKNGIVVQRDLCKWFVVATVFDFSPVLASLRLIFTTFAWKSASRVAWDDPSKCRCGQKTPNQVFDTEV
jgi:hypothetical protein